MIHLLDSGHSTLLFLGQLHMSRLFVLEIVDNVDLLCPSIVCFMFGIQVADLDCITVEYFV